MRLLKQGWLGILGDIIAFGPVIWRYIIKPLLGALSLGGDVDFVLEHASHLGWVATMIGVLGHPLAQIIVIGVGLGLIYLDPKRRFDSAKYSVSRWQRSNMWPLILIWIGTLIVLSGFTWAYLDYRSSQSEIASALARYVLPRHLSEEQIKKIADYLSQYPSHKFHTVLVEKNQEASSYASDIQKALKAGGWELGTTSLVNVDQVPEGLSYLITRTDESSQRLQQQKPDPKNPPVDALFNEAMKQAKMRAYPASSGGSSVTEDSFTVKVGRRRMDDGDLLRDRLMKERALKVLNDEETGGGFLWP